MKIIRQFGISLCLLFVSAASYTQYSIVVIQHATGGGCNGIIELQWTGASSEEQVVVHWTEPSKGPNPQSYTWDNGAQTFQIDGLCVSEYKFTFITADGCEVTLGTEIEGPGCYINEEIITPVILDQCGKRGNGEIELRMSNRADYQFSWVTVESTITGPVISNLFSDTYCVTITALNNSACTRYECYDVGYINDCRKRSENVAVTNEVKKGSGRSKFSSSSKEYIEILIAGNGTCEPVDIRHMIVDDNNGDFSNPSASSNSTGISQGHIRFKNIPRWLSVKPGAIIVIYNDKNANSAFTIEDDPTDSNNDNIYVLPHTDAGIEGCSDVPTTSNSSYADAVYGPPMWDYIDLKNSGDAMQLRYSDGSYCHGFSYGKANKMSGGPDNLLLLRNGASNKIFKFNSDDYRNEINFQVDDADESNESPGGANSEGNAEFTEQVFCDSLDLANEDKVLIVNEFSNGDRSGREYIELLVTGNSGMCDSVDLRGFIIDDNNGDFSTYNPGGHLNTHGISPGHIRFTYDDIWSAVPVGSLILIYNSDDINPAISLENDPSDENGDYVYVIPSNHTLIEGQIGSPSLNEPYVYNFSYDYSIADWGMIWGFNIGDAIQIRNPEGNYIHGISYGNIGGGVDNLNIHPYSGRNKYFAFKSGSATEPVNYRADRVSEGGETPGLFNGPENESFILELCDDHPAHPEAVTTPIPDTEFINAKSFHTVYPNPFRDELIIEYAAEKEMDGELVLVDMLGRVVLKKDCHLQAGMNKMQLNLDQGFSSGVYMLRLMSDDDEVLGSSTVSCINN